MYCNIFDYIITTSIILLILFDVSKKVYSFIKKKKFKIFNWNNNIIQNYNYNKFNNINLVNSQEEYDWGWFLDIDE